MKDAVEFYGAVSEEKSTVLKVQGLEKGNFVLSTIHRQENTDDKQKLVDIFKALDEIHQQTKVVLPLHPRTANKLKEYGIETTITLIDPVGYFDMLALLKNCTLVVTDSGGLQKEAFFNKKFCVIAREETEWIELVENGYATIVGSNIQLITEAFTTLKNKTKTFEEPLYGNNVGDKIYKAITTLIQA